MTRWLALTVTLCLAASVAGAEPIGDFSMMNAEASVVTREVRGTYFDVNQDTALILTTSYQPLVIDDTIIFGILDAGSRTRTVPSYFYVEAAPLPPSTPEPGRALLAAAGLGLSLLRRRQRAHRV